MKISPVLSLILWAEQVTWDYKEIHAVGPRQTKTFGRKHLAK